MVNPLVNARWTRAPFFGAALFFLTAGAYASTPRELLINKTMDCMELRASGRATATWKELCDDVPSGSQPRPQQDYSAPSPLWDDGNGSSQAQASQSQAQPAQSNAQAPQIPLAASERSSWNFEMETEISHIRYHEEVDGADFIRELGDMFSIEGIVTLHPRPGDAIGDALNLPFFNVYRLEGRFSYGQVNYRGSQQDVDTGDITPDNFDGIDDYMGEIRGVAGRDFYYNDRSLRLTPYFGVGYRYLWDSFAEHQPGGYDRQIMYLYMPFGGDVVTKLGGRWSLDINAEYDLFLHGFVESRTANLGVPNTWNSQGSGYGLRGSAKFIAAYDRYNLFVEPFVRFWSVHASNTVNTTVVVEDQPFTIGIQEPANTSLEVGTKLGIQF